MAQKRTHYTPEGSTELMEKFINYIMLHGKKSTARRILKDTLKIMEKRGEKNPIETLEKAISNTKPNMEIRPRRIGGAVYQIPVEVKTHRQLTLSLRWIINAARGKKGTKMAQKLANELIDAANEQGAAIKKRDDTHRMAEANKAFAHFAKYQSM